MTSLNRPARLNRALLSILGLVLVGSGGLAIALHFGNVPMLPASSPLVPGTDAPPVWSLYVTVAVCVVVGLLALRWLVAQLARKPKSHTWRMENDPDRGRTELAASTAIAPFLAETRGYPGVHDTFGTLAGTRQSPALALVITTEQDGSPTDIQERLDSHGLPRLRQALDLDTLPVTVEFRFTDKTHARVR
ncbi:hypothetical protein GCM10009765_21970 [Fodinicola feengrottensis]|uniref:Alkaline shock response membrane anchor protein AmaP n=1 Tax=Fodinicola feengrottensis TaxID=435914 RepID=A0ABN2GJ89_9ACTN